MARKKKYRINPQTLAMEQVEHGFRYWLRQTGNYIFAGIVIGVLLLFVLLTFFPSPREKQLQRALLQYSKPDNASLVREALRLAGREDLIGNGPDFLVRPAFGQHSGGYYAEKRTKSKRSSSRTGNKSVRGGSLRGAEAVYRRPETQVKRSKLDRVFGEDAAGIRRAADALANSDKKAKNRVNSQSKKAKSGSNTKKHNKK